jgi:hypothetical protein
LFPVRIPAASSARVPSPVRTCHSSRTSCLVPPFYRWAPNMLRGGPARLLDAPPLRTGSDAGVWSVRLRSWRRRGTCRGPGPICERVGFRARAVRVRFCSKRCASGRGETPPLGPLPLPVHGREVSSNPMTMTTAVAAVAAVDDGA